MMTVKEAAGAIDRYAGDAADIRPAVGGVTVPLQMLADLRDALLFEASREPSRDTPPWLRVNPYGVVGNDPDPRGYTATVWNGQATSVSPSV